MMTVAIICCALGGVPCVLLLANLIRYRRAPRVLRSKEQPRVSVLVPARNEEANIAACVESILQNREVNIELLVLDDSSTDRTAEIVEEMARNDQRLRLIRSAPLPRNWCGKQFACHQLSQAATAPYLVFLDADVRLAPDALRRSIEFLEAAGADLVSGVPRQWTGTMSEKLLIPLIHFVLLAYLPFGLMRRMKSAAFAAGCGQLFVARAEAYGKAGGHQSVAASRHDGLQLPRAFRKRGLKTDLFDPTDLCSCRMYKTNREVWAGLAKNAAEGIANPALIVPFTALLLAQVLPPILLIAGVILGWPLQTNAVLGVVTGLSCVARIACCLRFKQSRLGALLHPIAVLGFLAIQWWALCEERRGRALVWKGRPQPRFVE